MNRAFADGGREIPVRVLIDTPVPVIYFDEDTSRADRRAVMDAVLNFGPPATADPNGRPRDRIRGLIAELAAARSSPGIDAHVARNHSIAITHLEDALLRLEHGVHELPPLPHFRPAGIDPGEPRR